MKASVSMKKKLALGLVLFIAFACYIYYASTFRISKNFYTVEDERLYRSAQLSTQELKEVVEKYHIKTVISLRGSPGRTMYYETEAETLEKLKITFIPVALSDEYYPNEVYLKEIFHQFDHGQYPMLIHCRVGADRTGMIAALYQLTYMKKSLNQALEQLKFKYWHVPLFKPAMVNFVKKFKGVNWVMTEYHVCQPEFDDYREPDHVCKN